jgi:polysaccharide biosynthesis protein PslG
MPGVVVGGSKAAPTLGDILQRLKERSGASYDELARKTYTSRSTLHRYCTGKGVPPDAVTVTRIAEACAASPDEVRQALEAWLRAGEPAPAAPLVAPPAPPPQRTPEPRRTRWPRNAVIAVLLAALTAVTASAAQPSAGGEVAAPQRITGPSWVSAPVAVPPSLFGVTIVSDAGEMPGFRVGAVRFWDSGTRWTQLQPRRGEFDWTTLDRLVSGAAKAGLPAMFVFGGTPEWAAPAAPKAPYGDGSRAGPPDDLDDWDTFVRALAERFRGRIEAYELWVLANDTRFFTGSVETLVDMTRRASRIIKSVDPKATLVCPGMGQLWKTEGRRFMQRFAQLGGYQYCDVAGIKLYQRRAADPPESMLNILQTVDTTLHRAGVHPQLWSTGTTYDIATQAPLGEQDAVNHAMRFYLTGLYGRELNLRRMYFYSWGNTKIPIVLQAEGGAPTKAALAVETLQRWLAHASVRACGQGGAIRLPANVWQCDFMVDGGGQAMIRWTHAGVTDTAAPPGVRTVRGIDGSVTPVRPGDTIPVGPRPVLIEYR